MDATSIWQLPQVKSNQVISSHTYNREHWQNPSRFTLCQFTWSISYGSLNLSDLDFTTSIVSPSSNTRPDLISKLTMSWNTTNCPDGLPESSQVDIPSNITFAFVPSINTSNQAFVTCCDPNPVNIADGCFAWCEAPPPAGSEQTFSDCLTINEDGDSRWRHGTLGFYEKNTASTTSSRVGLFVLGIWVLSVTALF